jgi:hypothetical protein
MWGPRRLTTLSTSMACYRDSFTVYLQYIKWFNPVFSFHSLWGGTHTGKQLVRMDTFTWHTCGLILRFGLGATYSRPWKYRLYLTTKNMTVGSEVLTAVVMKTSVFWDITPCSPLKVNGRFGGTYRLHLQGRISRARYQREWCRQALARLTKWLIFVS